MRRMQHGLIRHGQIQARSADGLILVRRADGLILAPSAQVQPAHLLPAQLLSAHVMSEVPG